VKSPYVLLFVYIIQRLAIVDIIWLILALARFWNLAITYNSQLLEQL